jgi:hypothetical protein
MKKELKTLNLLKVLAGKMIALELMKISIIGT